MLLLIAFSLAASLIDLRERRIPNWICICIAAFGCVFQLVRLSSFFAPKIFAQLSYFPLLWRISFLLPSSLACLGTAFVCLAIGTVFELLVRKLSGSAGFGFGDIKYLSAWACILGWLVLPALALACAMGAAWALCAHERTFAFGPWLSLSFVAVLFLLLFTPTLSVLA